MIGKKAPLNILTVLDLPVLRSLTELPVISTIKSASEAVPDFKEIQSNFHIEQEYYCFSLEQAKKVPEAIHVWYKTLLKKKLTPLLRKEVASQASELCDIACSRFLNYISKAKHMKAYFILGVLEKLTGKNKLKFPEKKRFRSKLLLFTGYYYVKQKKYNAGLEFMLKAAEMSRRCKCVIEEVLSNALAAYTACRLSNHKLAFKINNENRLLIESQSQVFQYSSVTNIEMFGVSRVVALYNLSIESLYMYQRRDAQDYIRAAREISEDLTSYVLLKNKVNWLAEEICEEETERNRRGDVEVEREVEEREEEKEIEDSNINFLPGGIEGGDSKLVRLEIESKED